MRKWLPPVHCPHQPGACSTHPEQANGKAGSGAGLWLPGPSRAASSSSLSPYIHMGSTWTLPARPCSQPLSGPRNYHSTPSQARAPRLGLGHIATRGTGITPPVCGVGRCHWPPEAELLSLAKSLGWDGGLVTLGAPKSSEGAFELEPCRSQEAWQHWQRNRGSVGTALRVQTVPSLGAPAPLSLKLMTLQVPSRQAMVWSRSSDHCGLG
jgi:hypothetical protein